MGFSGGVDRPRNSEDVSYSDRRLKAVCVCSVALRCIEFLKNYQVYWINTKYYSILFLII